MPKLQVFNQVTVDGYFCDGNGDISWAKRNTEDPEWQSFVAENASGGGALLFGRVTYEMMASYWPTPAAMENNSIVAEQMNRLPKIVFSKTLDKATWQNTKIVNGDLIAEVQKMKKEPGKDIAILGSGSIVSQLTQTKLIDEYQIVVNPIVLGSGRTMFEGVKDSLNLKLTKTRTFRNGNTLLHYERI